MITVFAILNIFVDVFIIYTSLGTIISVYIKSIDNM